MNRRTATPDDLAAVAAFLAEDEEALLGRPSRIGEPDVRAWLDGVDLERGTWLYEDDAGIVAFGWVEAHGEIAVQIGVVAERAKGRGLGSELLERAEARLRQHDVARVHAVALAADPAAPALLAAHGYREVRRFWEMTIDLDEEPPAPELEAGLRLEGFDERDARAFHAALEEAFADHWEHQPRAFEEWWDQKRAAPDYDPTLWFLVRDGDEVAAVARNDPNRGGGGWIGALGVRRPWRGRGLGRALLLHSFREFRRRGWPHVGLGVDAENPTGATRLYESVGMRVAIEQVVYEKRLA
ncbi:MAG TPA: GNAT family N-acetyltransferase [Gaiellaceae bacterium]|nr:GNAT family N-acetyltransferase [Gaiellaceae bacterium]